MTENNIKSYTLDYIGKYNFYDEDEFDSMHFDFICRCEGDEWPE